MTFDEAHRRIKRGDIESIALALEQGLNPSEANRFGWSLLMLAAIQGTTEIGELLISRGASLDAVNDAGETALSLAAFGGHAKFVNLLVERGARLECRPHGHRLEDWLRLSSGLAAEKISAILRIINVRC
jgi:ankyrin repeat protein